jgi:hypothetical protein
MRRRALVILLAVLAALCERPAYADQVYFSGWAYVIQAAPIGVLPSEVGIVVQPSGPNFVFGWSWQVPFVYRLHQRIVGDVDLVVRSSGVSSAYGRLGYRYGGRHLFAGAGTGLGAGGVTLSPEVGVKFAHAEPYDQFGSDTSLHVLVRADVTPTTGHVTATALLGWNLF